MKTTHFGNIFYFFYFIKNDVSVGAFFSISPIEVRLFPSLIMKNQNEPFDELNSPFPIDDVFKVAYCLNEVTSVTDGVSIHML